MRYLKYGPWVRRYQYIPRKGAGFSDLEGCVYRLFSFPGRAWTLSLVFWRNIFVPVPLDREWGTIVLYLLVFFPLHSSVTLTIWSSTSFHFPFCRSTWGSGAPVSSLLSVDRLGGISHGRFSRSLFTCFSFLSLWPARPCIYCVLDGEWVRLLYFVLVWNMTSTPNVNLLEKQSSRP